MDKYQAIHNFWSSFTLKAYDENTVPDANLSNEPRLAYSEVGGSETGIIDEYTYGLIDSATGKDLPFLARITYNVAVGGFNDNIAMSASLWYRTKSWAEISAKAEEIYDYIGYGGVMVPFDGGAIWIRRGTPFAQRVSDEDDSFRRILLNIEAEYVSAQ